MSPYITTKNRYGGERSHNVSVPYSRLWLAANVAALAMIAALAFGYLAAINTVVAEGYSVKLLEKKLLDARRGGERLEAALAALRTPEALKASVATLGLIDVVDASYAKSEAAVAFRAPSP